MVKCGTRVEQSLVERNIRYEPLGYTDTITLNPEVTHLRENTELESSYDQAFSISVSP